MMKTPKSLHLKGLTITAILLLTSLSTPAAPTWMGVSGASKHYAQGGQDGRFGVTLNDSYEGLYVDIGIRVNGGTWNVYPMTVRKGSGMSYCDYYDPHLPDGAVVEYFFHAWDLWGFDMWDVNHGNNYFFTTTPISPMQWLGNTSHTAANGYYPRGWISVKTESWPAGSSIDTYIVYSCEREPNWQVEKMWYRGQAYNNDTWELVKDGWKLGSWIEYAIVSFDRFGNVLWDNNGGRNYRARAVGR